MAVANYYFPLTCSTKPPDDDNVTESDFIDTIDSSNVTSVHNFTESPTNFPGQFVSHNLCFGDSLTQRQVYYIYLVSLRKHVDIYTIIIIIIMLKIYA